MNAATADTVPGPFAAFRVRHFGLVWLSGLLWHLCRWGVAFVGSYLVNDLTGSPRLVQLVGTTLYAPLLIGGIIGGVVSDRFDRLNTVRLQMAVLAPFTFVIGLAVRSGSIEVWMLYVHLFAMGVGWVSDMTSRRALVFDLVGDGRVANAMALESVSLALGMAFGALVGGYAIEAVGIGAAYFFIAGFAFAALVLLAIVERPAARRSATSAATLADIRDGVRIVRHYRAVVGVLGVTMIANLFLFSYFPIIPVLAEKLDASAFLVGLLAGGTGIGMMLGSLVVAQRAPRRRGLVYLSGAFAALAFLVAFALSPVYWLALAMIVASGLGSGLFSAMQATLVMTAVPEEVRGRALGLLSMAIGALPVGMYLLGEIAERVGASTAIVVSAAIGAVLLSVWVKRRPEILTLEG
jgi:MFS family permease